MQLAFTKPFALVTHQACRDLQEVKVQEQIQHLDVGNIPRSISALLEVTANVKVSRFIAMLSNLPLSFLCSE